VDERETRGREKKGKGEGGEGRGRREGGKVVSYECMIYFGQL